MILLILAFGCARVDGTLIVEGAPVEIAGCASLAPSGFNGIDLVFRDDRVLRLFREGTAITDVGFFDDPASEEGFRVGPCATGEIRDTNTSTAEVVHLAGEAALACEDPLAVAGTVTFSGCH